MGGGLTPAGAQVGLVTEHRTWELAEHLHYRGTVSGIENTIPDSSKSQPHLKDSHPLRLPESPCHVCLARSSPRTHLPVQKIKSPIYSQAMPPASSPRTLGTGIVR